MSNYKDIRFRSLVAADIPNLAGSKITSGTVAAARITRANMIDGGTEGTKIAAGTTGQRGSTEGQVRYNSTTDSFEFYDGTIFHSINTNPTVTACDVTSVASAAGGTVDLTITGTNFKVGVVVRIIGDDSTVVTANSTTRTNSEQLVAEFDKSDFVNSKEPYDVKAENSDGAFATLANHINVDNPPTWTTASGSLGTLAYGSYAASNATNVVAADPDETPVITRVSGTYPTNFSLSSSGVWSGTTTDPGSETTYSFTLRATANSVTVDRAFSITVGTDNPPVFQTAAGSLGTLTQPSSGYAASNVTNVVATDAESHSITYAIQSGSIPAGLSFGSNGVWGGTATEPSSNTTSTFTVRATANSVTADRQFTITVNDQPPTFTTAAGSLGTLSYGGYGASNVTNVVASDTSGSSPTIAVVSGSIPGGLSLSSSGAWSGTATEPNTDTTSNFTLRATVGSGTVDRAFSVRVNHQPKGTSGNPGISCQDIYDAGDGASAGTKYIRPGSTTVQAHCDAGWTLVVRMNNQGSNSQNTTSAYNGIPGASGNTAKLSHSIIQELVGQSAFTNPNKVVFCGGVTRYINGGFSWTSSGNRNKGASWTTSTSSTSYSTKCGSASSPTLNNGGGGEWASNSISWPYMDGVCAHNGGFSTGGNCCGGGNGDAWGNQSGWSASTGCGSSGRSTMNIWIGG